MNKEELQNNYIEMLILDLEKHSFDYWESTQDEMVEALRKLQQENKQLKDNWNKLKEFIEKDYDFYDKLIAPEYGCSMGALSRIKDKMQELEQGSDSNV